MTLRQTGRALYAVALVGLGLALVGSAVRAQSASFKAKREEIRRQAREDRDKAKLSGEANRKKLFQLYPTPEIALAKPVVMSAGSTAQLSIAGKFTDKTTFVSYNDGVELTNAVVAPNLFKATVTAAAGLPPVWARIYGFAPVSEGEVWTPAVFIGAPRAFTLTASNGWIIKLTPEAAAFAFNKPGVASVTYKAQYSKPGATSPFETTSGSLQIDADNDAGSYMFMMSPGNSGTAMAEMQDLQTKMMALVKAGKMSGPEWDALDKKLTAASDRMSKEMQAAIKDPSAMQKKEDDFGCGTINLWIRGGQVSGNITCGKNVGSSLDFTGK
jgi:hypothetical protein